VLVDPVTGFRYPDGWVRSCRSPELLDKVGRGLCVLTASGTVLRRGYSTGAIAAAACKAAVLSLADAMDRVSVKLPCGLTVDVPVSADEGRAVAVKFSGDYRNDVTSGLEFVAIASPSGDGINLLAGRGIGRFTRDLPRYRTGDPSISVAAKEYIMAAIKEAAEVSGIDSVTVMLSIPRGEEIASRTLNSRLGILGGISVLGTTGLVEPWDDHVGESVIERVRSADRVVITTGRIGLRHSRLMFPDHEAVLVGTRLKEALEHARGEVVLCGMPALILKFIDPDILRNTGFGTVQELSASEKFSSIMRDRLERFRRRMPHVRVVLVDHDGNVVGDSG
jgi:cobalt-precorrin-5B (C1)-methyltransferase